jgi:hypothetical protein
MQLPSLAHTHRAHTQRGQETHTSRQGGENLAPCTQATAGALLWPLQTCQITQEPIDSFQSNTDLHRAKTGAVSAAQQPPQPHPNLCHTSPLCSNMPMLLAVRHTRLSLAACYHTT